MVLTNSFFPFVKLFNFWLQDGKLIQSNLILFLIEVGIRFLMAAQILFQYFAELCRTAHGIHILMSLKTSQLVCLQFFERQFSLIIYEIIIKAKKIENLCEKN